MPLILDTVTLDDNMQWIDRYRFDSVAQQVRRTVAGNVVTFAQGLAKGRPITLEASERQGWCTLTMAVVEQLRTLASIPGGIYTLQIETDFYQVQFRHEEPPAVDMIPLVSRLNQQTTDFMFGTIKLLEV